MQTSGFSLTNCLYVRQIVTEKVFYVENIVCMFKRLRKNYFRMQKVDLDGVDRYGGEHKAKELQKEAVYGLTELYRDQIKSARLVANPGCYPTSVQLPLMPLLKVDPPPLALGPACRVCSHHLSMFQVRGDCLEV